jgi:hypothetical protein
LSSLFFRHHPSRSRIDHFTPLPSGFVGDVENKLELVET